MKFKPFIVIDRPNLLTPAEWINKEVEIGLMSHAYISDNFASLWQKLDIDRICDSGVFLKSNYQRDITYKELMERYEEVGCHFGIIIDVLKDKDATIESAKEGMKVYQSDSYSFNLIGVAQGNTTEEYVECVKQLEDLGYTHIAIGGLLKKVDNTVRYVRVRSEDRMKEVFEAVREIWEGWLFSLGTYHPKRISLFEEYDIYGSDSKRWAFQCETGLETSERHRQVKTNFLKEVDEYYIKQQELPVQGKLF